MFSLGMSIGKEHHAWMKAWARVFNAIQMKKYMLKWGHLHSKVI